MLDEHDLTGAGSSVAARERCAYPPAIVTYTIDQNSCQVYHLTHTQFRELPTDCMRPC